MFSNKKCQILLALISVVLLATAPAANADDIYVQFEGIDGESAARRELQGAVDVLSWQWAMSKGGSEAGTALSRTSSSANIDALLFLHSIDKASPQLMRYLLTGKTVPKARLLIFASGTSAAPYLIIELEQVMVSSISTGGGSSDQRTVEEVGLSFVKFEFKYTEMDSRTGTPKGAVQASWNLATNTEK